MTPTDAARNCSHSPFNTCKPLPRARLHWPGCQYGIFPRGIRVVCERGTTIKYRVAGTCTVPAVTGIFAIARQPQVWQEFLFSAGTLL